MKLLIQIGGGLGDLLRCYFTDENSFNRMTHGSGEWSRLERICNEFNVAKEITVIGSTHNMEQCTNFLQYHPNIQEIYLEPWTVSGKELLDKYLNAGYKQLRDVFRLDAFEWERPQVFLTPAEQVEMEQIKKNKYVVIYPFLGTPEHEPWDVFKYHDLITELTTLGYDIVVLGGSYKRIWKNEETGYIEHRELRQEFPYATVKNYIGCGARLSTQLVIDAEFYIGTFGAYAMVAHAHQKNSFILHENWMHEHFQRGSSDCFFMSDSRTNRINVVNRNVQSITRQIIDTVIGWNV